MDQPPRRVGLVGCVAKKRLTAHLAQELDVSQLFTGRRSYVEQTCDKWWVLLGLSRCRLLRRRWFGRFGPF